MTRHTPLTFSVLHGRRPRLAFESLGFSYVHPHLAPPFYPMNSMREEELSCWSVISIMLSAACSALWCNLVNDDYLKVLLPIGWVLC